MKSDLDARTDKVLDFINAKAKEQAAIKYQDSLNASPEIKLKKLNDEYRNAPSVCIDTILGRLYKDALPFDDPKKNCSDDEARAEIHDYIARRTNGHNSEWYVREAIRRNNSSTLKGILNESTRIARKFYQEKAKNIGQINLDDLNFNMNMDDEGLSKISKKLELDEISDIIHNNVQKALQDESDKAKKEEEYNKQIEDALAQDTSVVDDASMESAMERMQVVKRPTIYQPSLFEAILLNRAGLMKESTNDNLISEAVHEYTKLNITKALQLEKFDLDSIRKLANSYVA